MVLTIVSTCARTRFFVAFVVDLLFSLFYDD